MPDSLSLNEVSTILGVSPLIVVRLTHRTIKAEKLPTINVDGEMRFDTKQFEAWKKANWNAEAFPMIKDRPLTHQQQRVERLTRGDELFPEEVEEL
jgi:hypothetical protein